MRRSILLILLFIYHLGFGQKNIDGLYSKLTSDPTIFSNVDSIDLLKYKKVFDYVKYLKGQKDELNTLTGKVSLGLRGNDNRSASRYDFTAGAELVKGYYPFNLKLKAMINTQFINGKLQENISDFHIALDYHLNQDKDKKLDIRQDGSYIKPDNLLFEGYVYADRYTNQYLGINQKYEVGGGMIINFFSSQNTKDLRNDEKKVKYKKSDFKGLTEKGGEKLKKLYDQSGISIDGNVIYYCDSVICDVLNDYKELLDKNSSIIRGEYNKASNGIRKKYSKFRLALLTGAFYEIEKATATDSITVNGTLENKSQDFEATNFLRWQIRPTFEFQTDNFNFKLKPYLKLPSPWDWESVVENNDKSLISKKVDYLFDLQVQAQYKVAKQFEIGLNIRYLYDNAPKRVFLSDLANEPLLVARNNHTFFNFSFAYNFQK